MSEMVVEIRKRAADALAGKPASVRKTVETCLPVIEAVAVAIAKAEAGVADAGGIRAAVAEVLPGEPDAFEPLMKRFDAALESRAQVSRQVVAIRAELDQIAEASRRPRRQRIVDPRITQLGDPWDPRPLTGSPGREV